MKNRKTSLLLATTSAAALAIFAYGTMGASPASAACMIGPGGGGGMPFFGGEGWNGSADPDDIDCSDAGVQGGDVLGRGGDDTITTDNTSLDLVDGGNGEDTIILLGVFGAAEIDEVRGGADNDAITLNGANIAGTIFGDGGDDEIVLINTDSDVIGVSGGEGDDTITANDANVSGFISGGAGEDSITINLDVSGNVSGGEDNDTIAMSGGTIDNLFGGTGSDKITMTGGVVEDDVEGGDDDDTISVTGGTVGNGGAADNVEGGAGNDDITVATFVFGSVYGDKTGATEGDDLVTINAGADVNNVFGDSGFGAPDDDGNDTIVMDGGLVRNDLGGNGGDDEINMTDGTVGNDVRGDDGNDTISITGGKVGLDVEGGAGNDVITVSTFVESSVYGDQTLGSDGEDTITINAGADVADVFGDSASFDGENANDTIVMTGGNVGGGILGEGGNDAITMTGGFVNDVIRGNDGDDTIAVDNATVGGTVRGDNDNDFILIDNASIGIDVRGDDGDDSITIQLAADIGDFVLGGIGDDEISMTGGTVGIDVEGNEGNDFVSIGVNAKVLANVEGNEGDDSIFVDGNASIGGSVFGDATDGPDGEDRIEIDNGKIAGNVFGDSGTPTDDDDQDDMIIINGGEISESVWGEGGDDIITMSNGLVIGNIYGDGVDEETGNDTITVNEGTVIGSVIGGDGKDSIEMHGGSAFSITGDQLANDTLGPGDDDFIALTGGEIDLDVWGQGGQDTILQDGATINRSIRGGLGGDSIELLSGLTNFVQGDAGKDTINLEGGSVFAITGDSFDGGVNGVGDDDIIELFGGNVGLDVWGQGGEDFILMDGATVAEDIQAGLDNDTVTLADGIIGGNAFGDGGDDMGFVVGGFNFANLGAGAGVFAGDQGKGDQSFDELDFIGWTGDVHADQLPEWNDIDIIFGSAVTFTGGVLETDGPSDIEVFIQDGSALLLNNDQPGGGNTVIVGNLNNEGAIDMSSADDGTDNILIVTGDYTASSDLILDTLLDDGKSAPDNSDVLEIQGYAGGQTNLTINVAPDSPGGLTGMGPSDGILVVAATTSDDDAFSLTNADLVAGIFEYELVNPEGQPGGRDDWYLQSDWLDQIYVYETLPGALQTIGAALSGQLVERVGVRSAVQSPLTDANGAPVAGGAPVDSAVWARAVGLSLDSEGDLESTTNGNFNQTIGFVQGGVDIAVLRRDSGRLVVGALGHWGTSTVDVNGADNVERGSANFDYYGGGLTATWYGTSGLYFDNVVQYTAYDIDISTATRFSNASTDGWGFSTAHEVGYRIPVGATTAIVPQAQITYQTVEFDDFVDPDGVLVSFQDDDSLIGRLGVAVENNAAIGSSLVTGYLEANLIHEFLGDNTVNTFTPEGGTIPISQDLGGTSVELGFGGTIAVNQGVSLYAEVDYTIPFDNGLQGFQALGGIRVNLNPAPPPPPPPPAVVVEQPTSAFIVFFDWDRADLTPEANLVLDDVVVVANEAGYASIRLDGYTDLSGSAQYNLGLSERRANSVANGLIARGIAPDEIVIRAFGEENPLVPTPDGVREPQNRRVEIFLS